MRSQMASSIHADGRISFCKGSSGHALPDVWFVWQGHLDGKITVTRQASIDRLIRDAAFARRGQKVMARAKLKHAVENQLREFVARGPVQDAQMDLFV